MGPYTIRAFKSCQKYLLASCCRSCLSTTCSESTGRAEARRSKCAEYKGTFHVCHSSYDGWLCIFVMECIRTWKEGTSGGVVTRFSVTGHPMPSNVDRRVACDSLRVEGERSWFGKHEKIVLLFGRRCGAFPPARSYIGKMTLDDSDFHILRFSASQILTRRLGEAVAIHKKRKGLVVHLVTSPSLRGIVLIWTKASENFG